MNKLALPVSDQIQFLLFPSQHVSLVFGSAQLNLPSRT